MNYDDGPSNCLCCFVIVKQSTTAVIERFGRFAGLMNPGINFINPITSRVAGYRSHRTQQHVANTLTKTKDNVSVEIKTAINYNISENNVEKAFYSLREHVKYIESFVDDIVRSQVPKLTLDELYESKEELCAEVKRYVEDEMTNFGFTILKVLLTDIKPNEKVVVAMNEINAAQRNKMATIEKAEAAKEKLVIESEANRLRTVIDAEANKSKIILEAEADKIRMLSEAEAESEYKRLIGEGIAKQKRAILNGYKDAMSDFKDKLNLDNESAINLSTMIEYFDVMKSIGTSNNSKTSFIPYSPANMNDIKNSIRQGIMEGRTME